MVWLITMPKTHLNGQIIVKLLHVDIFSTLLKSQNPAYKAGMEASLLATQEPFKELIW